MAIKEFEHQVVFLVCYLLFMLAILLIPVARNCYCGRIHNMRFSQYSQKIVDSFLENNTCVYVAKFHGYRNVLLFFMLFILVVFTPPFVYSGDKYSQYYFLLLAAVWILLHIAWISHYASFLYDACYITHTSMLIRVFHTSWSFKIVKLHDIERYRTDNFYTADRLYFGAKQHILIIIKEDKAFNFRYLANRDELIHVLKSFTNSFEET